MKTIAELKSDLEFELRSAQKIMDSVNEADGILGEEELEQIKQHEDRAAEIEQEIEVRKRHIATEERLKERIEASRNFGERKTESIKAGDLHEGGYEFKKLEIPNVSRARLRCFKGENGPETAYKFGAWMAAEILGSDHWKRKVRDMGISSRALSETTNTAGGAVVPSEMADFIINLREEYGVAEQECFVYPMTSDHLEVPRISGRMSASYFGEGATLTTSDAQFGSLELTAKKGGILTYISNELAEDAMIQLADLLASEMALEFAEQIDDAVFNGDGSATYAGQYGIFNKIVAAGSSANAWVDAASGTDTLAEIAAADLSSVKAALAGYTIKRGNVKWYCSTSAKSNVFDRLQMAAGGNTRRETADGPIPMYDGHDIVLSELLPTGGTINNTEMLGVGDLRAAGILGQRRRIDIATSNDFRFGNDQSAIRAIQRFAWVTVPELDSTSANGPFAALIGNT